MTVTPTCYTTQWTYRWLHICRLIKWYLMKALASQHEYLLASVIRNFVKWVLRPCDEVRRSRDSSVGIAMCCMAKIRFLAEARDFLFSTASRLTLGHIQPPMQGVSWTLSPEVKRPGREADHSPPSIAEVKTDGAIQPLPYMSPWGGA
jgi:hypothetical protein